MAFACFCKSFRIMSLNVTSSYIIKDTAKVAKTSVHNVGHVPSNNFESCCPFQRRNSVNHGAWRSQRISCKSCSGCGSTLTLGTVRTFQNFNLPSGGLAWQGPPKSRIKLYQCIRHIGSTPQCSFFPHHPGKAWRRQWQLPEPNG